MTVKGTFRDHRVGASVTHGACLSLYDNTPMYGIWGPPIFLPIMFLEVFLWAYTQVCLCRQIPSRETARSKGTDIKYFSKCGQITLQNVCTSRLTHPQCTRRHPPCSLESVCHGAEGRQADPGLCLVPQVVWCPGQPSAWPRRPHESCVLSSWCSAQSGRPQAAGRSGAGPACA